MDENKRMVLSKKNYLFIIIGSVVVLLGLILMSGGGSENSEVFSPEIFSFRRITLAPFLIIVGYMLVLFGILKKE